MKNKLYVLINFNKQKLKETFLCFTAGFFISVSFVLYSNELFYRNVIQGRNGYKGFLNEFTPREILGTGAKKTFINHQFDSKNPEEIYKEYIDQRNKENSAEVEQISENELNVLMNRQREKDVLETYKRNIFDQK
jgi:hypothetical protein